MHTHADREHNQYLVEMKNEAVRDMSNYDRLTPAGRWKHCGNGGGYCPMDPEWDRPNKPARGPRYSLTPAQLRRMGITF